MNKYAQLNALLYIIPIVVRSVYTQDDFIQHYLKKLFPLKIHSFWKIILSILELNTLLLLVTEMPPTQSWILCESRQ